MDKLEPYIGLFIQIPLVVLFVWFALRQNKDFLDAMAKHDEQIAKRDEQWRIFLKEHTESTNAAISRIAEEVKSIAREVSELRGRSK